MSEIVLERAILHIMDTGVSIPVLSDKLMEITSDIHEFLVKHIEKLLDDPEFKECIFTDGNNSIKDLIMGVNEGNFIETSQKLGAALFNIMYINTEIPPADVVFCNFKYHQRNYFGIIKFNYKTSYIHHLEVGKDKGTKIIQQKTAIANEKQKVDECIFVDLNNHLILVKEKVYEINGNKDFYLTNHFLKAESKLSLKEKYNILQKTAQEVIKEYYHDDIKKASEVKNAIKASLNEDMELDIDQVAKKAFYENDAVQAHYKKEISEKGFNEDTMKINRQIERKIEKKQRLITDTGIEINIPSEYVNDSQKIEFIMNPDGTISILIKSIGNVIGK